MSEETTTMKPAVEPVRKIWGLQKSASVLTKSNKGKKRVQVGNVREILKDIVKHDASLVMEANQPEIVRALLNEIYKKSVAKGANVDFAGFLKIYFGL